MKTRVNPFLRSASLAASFCLCLGTVASAADLYWDFNGNTTGTGGAGNWSTANTWRTGSDIGSLGSWVDGNTAVFGGTAGAVTITSGVAITAPKINVLSNNYTLSGGTVAFGGTVSSPGIIDVNNSTGFSLASNATGSLKIQSTGNAAALNTAAPLTISGSTNLTSFELALATDSNHIILGNAAALGTASSTVKLSKGVLNLGAADGSSTLTYQAWVTDLAGGTIRARFNTGTWTGASSLSADTQLMTRNASGVKLVFSNTGTINLNDRTLTLMASSASSGIELNGAISGTGNLVTGGLQFGGSENALGTTLLGAANTFSGTATTTLNLGPLALNHVNALQNATLNTGTSGTQSVTFVAAGTNTYNIGALAGSDDLAIGANSISIGNKAGIHSFSANISGAGGLTKAGASSTQSLTAATGYTGATSITGGTLALSGAGAMNNSSGISINGASAKLLHTGSTAVSSAVTLTNGTLTGSGTINTVSVGAGTGGIISNNNGVAGNVLTIGSLTLAGGASINVYSNSTSAPLNVSSLTNHSGAGQVIITANNAGGWINGSIYNLIGYTTLGGTGGNNFGHLVNNLSARQSATWGDSGSAITLAIAGDTPYWTGAATGGKWNASDQNWKLVTAGTDTTFLVNDDVLFDDNATGTTTINIDAANVAPSTTAFNNSSKDYTLTGAFGISAGNFTKNGSGSLTIGTNNSYTGPTTLNSGSVTLSGSGTLGSNSALTLNGAALDLGSTSQSSGAVSITAAAASGDTVSNGSIAGSSYAVSNSTGTVGISANLLANGAAGFTKSGAGGVTLSGSNTYTGATAINGGTLTLSGSGTLGSGAGLSLGGGSLNLGGSTQLTGAVSITAAAISGNTISNGSLTGTSYAASNISGDAIISANLLVSGAAGFTKSGAGIATLSGTNTYTGATVINAGTLKAGSATAFQNTGALSLANASGVIFDLNGNNASFTTLTTGAATNSITTTAAGSGTDTFTLSAFAVDAGIGALITDNGTRKLQLNLTSGGVGSWPATTNSGNTYSGGLVLGGFMRPKVLAGTVGTPGAIASGPFGRGIITVNGSSQIWFDSSNRNLVNDVIVNGNAGNGNRAGTFRIGTNSTALTNIEISGNITANLADAHFGSDSSSNGNALLLSGKLSGNSGFRFFVSSGSSTWTTTLNNTTGSPNDYAGATTISSANTILALGASNQIPNGSGKGNFALTSGFLDLAGFDDTINGLTGAGLVDNALTGTANTLTLGDGNATGTNFSGIIRNTAGSLSLTKIGTGTQILSGPNTYTGATLISAGTLQIGNGAATGSLSASSTITNNGTLAFNHTGTLTQGTDFAAGMTGSGALTKTGSGTVILSGTNSFNGSTTVSDGELRLNSAGAIGSTEILVSAGRLSLNGGIVTGSGKTVTVNGTGANFFGALQSNAGANTWQGNVVVGSTAGTRIGVNAGSLKIEGAISGSNATNGVTLRPNSSTTLELAGASSYLGDTSIISGTGEVKLSGGANRLPTATKLIFGSGGTSGILNLNGQNQEIAGMSVAGGTNNEIKSTTAATLTINAASASSFAGIITGAAALSKTGGETLTLTGTNTYTGNTTITAGALALTGTGSIANSANIKVNGALDVSGLTSPSFTVGAAQTLSGQGTINATGKTFSIAGTHSVGNSPGIQSITATTVDYSAGSIFEWELVENVENGSWDHDSNSGTVEVATRGSAFDAVNITGNLAVDETASTGAIFKIVLGRDFSSSDAFWTANRSWDIFSVTGENTTSFKNFVVYNASDLANPVSYDGSGSFGYSFTSNTGTLTWSAVPEPTSALAGILLGAGLLRRRRSHR